MLRFVCRPAEGPGLFYKVGDPVERHLLLFARAHILDGRGSGFELLRPHDHYVGDAARLAYSICFFILPASG